MTIAVALSYLESARKLDKRSSDEAFKVLEKLRINPEASGLNIEKLKNAPKYVRSVRINDNFRAIGVKKGDVLTLVHCDDHSGAYQWINGRTIGDNVENAIIIADNVSISDEHPRDFLGKLGNYSDEQMGMLGFTPDEISAIKNAADQYTFDVVRSILSPDKSALLDFCVKGESFNEMMEIVKVSPAIEENGTEISEQRGVFLISDEYSVDELKLALNDEIEMWRIFLHPAQEEYAFGSFDGAVLINGAAGTGKTVVALHRAAFLVKSLEDNVKMLFTTFTKNLTTDIAEMISEM